MPKTITAELDDAFVTDIRELVSEIHLRQWEIGDRIAKKGLSSDAMSKLAQLCGISVKTLRLYEELAREFPPGPKRDTKIAWSTYKELTRVSDPVARDRIRKARPAGEWTTDAMRGAVNAWIVKHGVSDSLSKRRTGKPLLAQNRQGMGFPSGVRVVGEETSGELTMTVHAPGMGEVKVIQLGKQAIIHIELADD